MFTKKPCRILQGFFVKEKTSIAWGRCSLAANYSPGYIK